MKKTLFLILILSISINSYAHVSTPLTLKKDGTLVGLPEKYSPAHFSKKTYTLTIAKNQIKLPYCVKNRFRRFREIEFRFLASWYHPSSWGPPSMSIIIEDKKTRDEISIGFELDTLKIVQIAKPIKHDQSSYSTKKLNISAECEEAILKAIYKRK